MSNGSKKKSTIAAAAFKDGAEHNVEQCCICDRIQL